MILPARRRRGPDDSDGLRPGSARRPVGRAHRHRCRPPRNGENRAKSVRRRSVPEGLMKSKYLKAPFCLRFVRWTRRDRAANTACVRNAPGERRTTGRTVAVFEHSAKPTLAPPFSRRRAPGVCAKPPPSSRRRVPGVRARRGPGLFIFSARVNTCRTYYLCKHTPLTDVVLRDSAYRRGYAVRSMVTTGVL